MESRAEMLEGSAAEARPANLEGAEVESVEGIQAESAEGMEVESVGEMQAESVGGMEVESVGVMQAEGIEGTDREDVVQIRGPKVRAVRPRGLLTAA